LGVLGAAVRNGKPSLGDEFVAKLFEIIGDKLTTVIGKPLSDFAIWQLVSPFPNKSVKVALDLI